MTIFRDCFARRFFFVFKLLHVAFILILCVSLSWLLSALIPTFYHIISYRYRWGMPPRVPLDPPPCIDPSSVHIASWRSSRWVVAGQLAGLSLDDPLRDGHAAARRRVVVVRCPIILESAVCGCLSIGVTEISQ